MHAAATFPLAASYTTSRYWMIFCMWSSSPRFCHLLFNNPKIQVSCWNTQKPDGNVVAFLPWWPWRYKLTHFSFCKALKLPTPAVQQEGVSPCQCSSKTKTPVRHCGKPVPVLFPALLCLCWCCWGAFWVACSCPPSCPVGMVPPCCRGLLAAAFNWICSFVLLPAPPFISSPLCWGFSCPLSPAPCLCSALQVLGPRQSPAVRDTSPVPRHALNSKSAVMIFIASFFSPSLSLEVGSVFPYSRQCEQRETRLKAKFPLTSVGAGFHLECFMFWALDNNMKGLHTCKTWNATAIQAKQTQMKFLVPPPSPSPWPRMLLPRPVKVVNLSS